MFLFYKFVRIVKFFRVQHRVTKFIAVFVIAPEMANPREVGVVESSAPKRLSGIGFEAREVAARIYAAMRCAGIKTADARSYVQAGIPNVNERTLRDWVRRLQSDGHLFAGEKGSGQPECIHDDNIRILVGWILKKTDSGTIVRMKDALLF